MAASAAAAAIATATTLYSQDRAESRAEDAMEAQEELASKQTAVRASQAAKARRQRINRAMLARAEVENQAASQGATGSSAAIQGAQGATAQGALGVQDVNTSVNQQSVLEDARQGVVNAQNQTAGVAETLSSAVGSQFTGALVSKGAEKLFE